MLSQFDSVSEAFAADVAFHPYMQTLVNPFMPAAIAFFRERHVTSSTLVFFQAFVLLLVLVKAVGTAKFLATKPTPVGLPGRVFPFMLIQVFQGDELGVAFFALVEAGILAAAAGVCQGRFVGSADIA